VIVRLEGLENSINALATLDKKAYGAIVKEIKGESESVLNDARKLTPPIALTNWGIWRLARDGRDFSYGPMRLKNTLKTSVRRRSESVRNGVVRKASIRVVAYSNDPVAVIFQTAGRGDKGGDPFARNLTKNWGDTSKRYLWGAIEDAGDGPRQRINALMDQAAREVQSLLDRAA